MSKLAEAALKLDIQLGRVKGPETLEEKILKLANYPPLTKDENIACQATAVAAGDWGPVFVYGQMLSQQAWCALIDRVPEMRPCWLRGWERREIICSTFAGLVKNDDPDALVVGQAILGLMPWERRLLDEVVDDAFQLIDVTIQPLDKLEESWPSTTYVWREDRFPNAVSEKDWDQERFNAEHEEEFKHMCSDMLENYRCTKISDAELREMSLRRRREQTGFEDEEEFQQEDDEDKDDEDDEDNYDHDDDQDDHDTTTTTMAMTGGSLKL